VTFWRSTPQVLCGYYDNPDETIATWLSYANANGANVVGAMYTTWEDDYSQMQAFASQAGF
jgi:tripartite-type tricarboxylate transporter receptor subunit TctC